MTMPQALWAVFLALERSSPVLHSGWVVWTGSVSSLLCSPGIVGLPKASHEAPHPVLQLNPSPKILLKVNSFSLFLLVFSLFFYFLILSSFCLSSSACLTSFLPLIMAFVSFFLLCSFFYFHFLLIMKVRSQLMGIYPTDLLAHR